MSPLRKRALFLAAAFITLAIAAALTLSALQESLLYFVTPTEMQQQAPEAVQKKWRLGGIVAKGSLVALPNNTVQFSVTDAQTSITIEFQGLLPDLFREEQTIIADGYWNPNQNLFTATRVLAKHDENYRPPEGSIYAPAPQ